MLSPPPSSPPYANLRQYPAISPAYNCISNSYNPPASECLAPCTQAYPNPPFSQSSSGVFRGAFESVDFAQILLTLLAPLLPYIASYVYQYLRRFRVQIVRYEPERESQDRNQSKNSSLHPQLLQHSKSRLDQPDFHSPNRDCRPCHCNSTPTTTPEMPLDGVTSTLGGVTGGLPAVPGAPALPVGGAGGGQQQGTQANDIQSRGLNVAGLVGVGSNEKAAVDLLAEEKKEQEAAKKNAEQEKAKNQQLEQQRQQGNQANGTNQNSGSGGGSGTQGGGGGTGNAGGGQYSGASGGQGQCGCHHAFYPICSHNQGHAVPITMYFSHLHCGACQPTHPAPNTTGGQYSDGTGGGGGEGGGGGGTGGGQQNCVAQPPQRTRITPEATAESFARSRQAAGDQRPLDVIYEEALNDIKGTTTDYTDRSGACSSCGKPWASHPAGGH